MHWILQENLFNESEWSTLVDTLERMGLPYSVHKVVPFSGELIPPAEPKHPKVICFGSYSMRHTAKAQGWSPGVYDLFDQNFEVQRSYWGHLLLNNDSKVVAFKDAVITEESFIRPIDDSKYFAGHLIEPEEFHDWQRRVVDLKEDTGTGLTGDTLIQINQPKEIYAEYRFWIVDKKIITKSLYKRGGQVHYSADVDPMIGQTLGAILAPACWEPARAYVVDVCQTPDGIKIVEINTINAAGFYAGDIQKLVMALEEAEG